MKRRTFLLLALSLVLTVGAGAQESKMAQYTKRLAATFAQDGVVVQTGFDAAGTQNLAVLAFGGYFPLQVTAKAGVPTVLRLYTDKTYDCSRAFLLPDLKKRAVLPVKGEASFELGPQKKGTTLFGTCGMGMYTFEIRFE